MIVTIPGITNPLGGSGIGVVPGYSNTNITNYNPATGVISGNANPNLVIVLTVSGSFAVNTISNSQGLWTANIGIANLPRLISAIAIPPGTFTASAAAFGTLNPNDKASTITLSNNNLTDTFTGASSTFGNVRATTSRSTGKYFFEVTIIAVSSGGYINAGLATSSLGLTVTPLGSTYTNCISGGTGGLSYYNPGNTNAAASGGSAFSAGLVIGLAVNLDAGTTSYYLSGSINYTVNNPAGTLFPFLGASVQNAATTLNVGASPFAYGLPSGYSAWA